MIKQNKQSLRDKGFCIKSCRVNPRGDSLVPIHPDSYKIYPTQNRFGYEKIFNLVDEADNVCCTCGEYHSIQGRELRPSSEALKVWIEIEAKMKKTNGGMSNV